MSMIGVPVLHMRRLKHRLINIYSAKERERGKRKFVLILLKEMRKLHCSINCMEHNICLSSRDNMSQIHVISLVRLHLLLISKHYSFFYIGLQKIHFHQRWLSIKQADMEELAVSNWKKLSGRFFTCISPQKTVPDHSE